MRWVRADRWIGIHLFFRRCLSFSLLLPQDCWPYADADIASGLFPLSLDQTTTERNKRKRNKGFSLLTHFFALMLWFS
jgi:hypothetical protein